MPEEGILAAVKGMSSDQRVKFHTKRVEREEPGCLLIEQLDTGLSSVDLKGELKQHRKAISTIEQKIQVFTCPCFVKKFRRLEFLVASIEQVRGRLESEKSVKLKQHFQSREASLVQDLRKLESELQKVCEEKSVEYKVLFKTHV